MTSPVHATRLQVAIKDWGRPPLRRGDLPQDIGRSVTVKRANSTRDKRFLVALMEVLWVLPPIRGAVSTLP